MSGDDRVVGIEFDHSRFEANVNKTIASLDQLNATLEKQGGKKALEDLATASGKVDVSGITAGIEGVSAKFLALSTIGITVLANIASKAISVGVDIAKSLSLDQVISGFQEYETNMNSIQTIMSNTRKDGTTLDQVGTALQQLNEYSDKTIYNFGEMARNIGTFTAAGIDLDTSVESIKGIANLAAASGSSSQQAATAMYQLSQAIASGSVKLMDWNSVVNAGMGGEMFQEALFNAGKLKGTLDGVDAATTFDQWKTAGNTFRDSLEDGWITADVLTTTLKGFTGDLTEAQIMAMGYTQAQAAEIFAMGKDAQDAATKVKTFTQLIGTVKEAIGSGWSESFKIIIGDFEEAKELFTNINNVIGGIVGASADSRNELLQGWKDLGGRAMLIDALGKAFAALGDIIAPIQRAFRQIFPPMTAQRLADLTWQFRNFIEKISPGTATILRLHRIFLGIFAALEIGWTVIKELAGAIGELFSSATEGTGGGLLKFLANIGDNIVKLNEVLVEGGGIKAFFDGLTEAVKDPLPHLIALKDKIIEFISGFSIGSFDLGTIFGEAPAVFDRIGQRFETLRGIAEKVGDAFRVAADVLSDLWNKISPVLDEVFDYIHDWFSELGGKLADATKPGDFNNVVDAVNVGLLGGIAVILTKFLKNGLDIDFGGGMLSGITKSFDQLTGTLKAMETQIKADALMKIAIAIGILTASVLVLSLIDSEALARSLGALAIGFGQLIGAMALLNTISSGPKGAAGLVLLSTGLILLAGAILLLSVALKIMSTLSWEDMAKGLITTTVLLGLLAAVVKPLSSNAGGMILAGAGIIALAIGLNILALALKSFAEMSWAEMAQGLVGVAIGLGIIAIAMKAMPKASSLPNAVAIGVVAVALNILALAVKSFAEMSLSDMGKGLGAVAVSLGLIAAAMKLMPVTMLAQAAGLALVGVALNLIAAAVNQMAGLSWEELAKGIGAMAATLLVLGIAAAAMSGSIGGAIAIGVMAVSLGLLADVLQQLGKMKLSEVGIGLLALAGILVVFGLGALALSPVVPIILALGIAIGVLGVGMVLFGAGAALLATAFATIAKAGTAGIEVLIKFIDALILKLPEIATAFGLSLIAMVTTFLEAAPVLIAALGIVIEQILQTIIDLTPELVATIITVISGLLTSIAELYPQFVATGLAMLVALLTGIRDNIGEVTTLVIEIIVEFVNAVAANLNQIIDAAYNLLAQFLLGIAERIGDVTEAAIDIVVALAKGLSDNVSKIVSEATNIITKFLAEIAASAVKMIAAGTKFITDIITGIGNAAEDIVTAGANAIISFLQGVADNAQKVIDAGFDIIIDLLNGIANSIRDNSEEFRQAGVNIATAIADGMTAGLASKAKSVVDGAIGIAGKAVGGVKSFLGINSPSRVFIEIGESMAEGLVKGLDEDVTAENAAIDLANRTTNAVQEAMKKVPAVIAGLEEFNPTITPVLDLSEIKRGAATITDLFPANNMSPLPTIHSYEQARVISASSNANQEVSSTSEPTAKDVKFEQNIYAPTALSTADIYRQTRNQIALVKEELEIA